MTLPISDHCRSCIIALQEVISILSQPDRNNRHVQLFQVCEDLDRFKLFIGNIGALHPSESPLSIESRLQEANDVLNHISGLLTDLNEVTTELFDIVSGKREGMVSLADEAGEKQEVISEANELREEISGTITRLFRVSILIRQAAPSDIFAKALSRNRYRFNDQFDIAHVGEKYRKLAAEDYAWLRQRLGRAITQRRHYLSYVQDHREKLGGKIIDQEKADKWAAKSPAHGIKQPLDSKLMLDAESHPSFFTKATTVAAEGIKITPQLQAAEDSDPEDDARSYTTVSRSIDGDQESSANVRIPKLDTLRVGYQNEFECPFCFRIKKFKSERIWRKHVFSDLRPYVCTFPDCDAPYFGDINKWFQHEMNFHRVNYNCFLCQKVYYQEKRYLAHLSQEHRETLEDGGAQVGTDLARKPLAQIPASDCPCCSDWAGRLEERVIQTSGSAHTGILAVTPTVFKRHLAAHLEQLALFAVPIGAATDGNDDSNAAIEEDRRQSTCVLGTSTLTFASFRGDFGNTRSQAEVDPSKSDDAQPHLLGLGLDIEHEVARVSSLPSDSSGIRGQDRANDLPTTTIVSDIGPELEKTVEENKIKFGENHPYTLTDMRILASNHRTHRRWKEAGELFERVLEVNRRILGDESPSTLISMKDLASNYESECRWEEAERLLEQIVDINKRTLGTGHPDTLDSMKNLASNYENQRRWEEAEKLLLQVTDIAQKEFGRYHLDTIASMENLASNYRSQGRWKEAEVIYRRMIGAYGKVVRRDDLRILSSTENLASVLEKQGRLEESSDMRIEALTGLEMLLGADHLRTLANKEQLVSLWVRQGELNVAETLQREVLLQFKRLLGPEDPRTILAKEQLVSILRKLGKSNEAEVVQKEVLAWRKNVVGPEVTSTISSKEELVVILEEQGKLGEAEALQREVVSAYENEAGAQEPGTLRKKEELASLLEKVGKLTEAELLQRKVLEGYSTLFGSEHILTISSMERLAWILRAQGRFGDEEPLRRNALSFYQKSFRQDDKRTLSALSELADTLGVQERLQEAEALYREALVSYNKEFGPYDDDTISTTSKLASNLETQGKLGEAEDLYMRAVAAGEEMFGGDDEETVLNMIDLADVLEEQGKLEDTEQVRRKIFDSRARTLGPTDLDTLDSMMNLASIQEKQGKFEEAEETNRKALEIWSSSDRPDRGVRQWQHLYRLSIALQMQGKDKEAEDVREQVSKAEQELELEHKIEQQLRDSE